MKRCDKRKDGGVGKTKQDGGGYVAKAKDGSWLSRKPESKKQAMKQVEAVHIAESEGK